MTPFTSDQYYSTTDLVELGQRDLFPVKTLVTINKLINSGRIKSVNVGNKRKKRFRIKGQWLNEFLQENKKV